VIAMRGVRTREDDLLEDIDHCRRRFLGGSAMTLVGARFGLLGAVVGPPACAPPPLRVEGELLSLDGATQWLNSEALTAASLRGKVVLIDFCTYSCINWIRTLPYVRAWEEKYKADGLVVIGIHTPEFPFENNPDNVRDALKAMMVTFPVALDNDRGIWQAFGNEYWPALYFVDARGRIRHHYFGEGNYEQSEQVIQRLIVEAGNSDVGRGLVSVHGTGTETEADWGSLKSPENYVGYGRTQRFASPGGASIEQPRRYSPPVHLHRNQWALSGNWTIRQGSIQLNEANGRIAYRFHARDLNLVMGLSSRGVSQTFRVFVDGRPPGAAHGIDVDSEGNGTLSEPRLYQLIRQKKPIDDRKFEIVFGDAGVNAFSFTFG
jgi:thiol-disulfide isomerase/thioredoxin